MGILKDTYNITNIDTSKIGYELSRRNDFEEARLKFDEEHMERVDISLKKYEEMLKTIENQEKLIKSYDNFMNKLAIKIQRSPEELLKYECIRAEVERSPVTMRANLYLVFKIND